MNSDQIIDEVLAEERGEAPTKKMTRPECPHCAAKPLYRADCQYWTDNTQTRVKTGYRCFRCGGFWNVDLTPGVPLPEAEWYTIRPDGSTYSTVAQGRRDWRRTRAINREIEEHNKTVKFHNKQELDKKQREIEEQLKDRRRKLLHLYQSGAPHCEECGETDLAVLQRHHIDGNKNNEKRDNIIILCANDHWRRTMPKKSSRYQNPTLLTPSLIHPHKAPKE